MPLTSGIETIRRGWRTRSSPCPLGPSGYSLLRREFCYVNIIFWLFVCILTECSHCVQRAEYSRLAEPGQIGITRTYRVPILRIDTPFEIVLSCTFCTFIIIFLLTLIVTRFKALQSVHHLTLPPFSIRRMTILKFSF